MALLTAEQARKNAEQNKTHTDDVEHLKNHFDQLIHKAVNSGKYTIERQSFGKDRFKPLVLKEVLDHLKTSGYKVSEGSNNALQLITIDISW